MSLTHLPVRQHKVIVQILSAFSLLEVFDGAGLAITVVCLRVLFVILVDANERRVLLHQRRARLLCRLHVLVVRCEPRINLQTVVLTCGRHDSLLVVSLSATRRA